MAFLNETGLNRLWEHILSKIGDKIAAAASSITPKAAGTASAGTETTFARGDHVHPAQTTISGNAGSANKVNSNLVIKLNSGSTEGTNLFTFNGSAAKTINITASSIGAAASSHTHDYLPLDGGIITGGTVDIAAGTLKIKTINAPTTSTGDIYGTGSEGQVLKSNGSKVYWGTVSAGTNYELPLAKSDTRGGVKIGYSESDKNYAVKLNTDEKMYVTVPWANTHYTTRLYAGASETVANAAATNPYLKVTDDNTYRNQIQFKGGGATTVSSDANGVITISSTDNNSDTKVTQTVTTTNANYPILLAPSEQTATKTTTSYFDSDVTLNPYTNTIAANISGNAASATKATQDGSGNIITSTYLPLSGGTLTGAITLKNSSQYPIINFLSTKATSGSGASIIEDIGSTSNYTKNQIVFRVYSPTSSGATTTNAHYENFKLPSCNIGRTNDADYNILTTKNAGTSLPTTNCSEGDIFFLYNA